MCPSEPKKTVTKMCLSVGMSYISTFSQASDVLAKTFILRADIC